MSMMTDEIHAIIGGLVGGLRYGIKIRLPHAFVMTALFRRDLSSEQKLRTIWNLTREHALNLASFATIYKTILALLKVASRRLHNTHDLKKKSFLYSLGRLIATALSPSRGQQHLVERGPGIPECNYHALVAGAIGGYLVWGRYSSVNYQVVLYLTSRVLVGIGKKVAEHFNISHHTGNSYPLFAATVWGLVMVLFEESPHVLHSSLKKSMEEIYRYQVSENK